MDLDATRGLLVQESRELLAAMEEGLLSIERQGMSRDAINAVFRAAHTIKGSAGLFGLTGIVAFTHVMENVLDRVRGQKLAMDEQLFSVLLSAGDYLTRLIDGLAQGSEHEEPDASQRNAILNALARYLPDHPAAELPALPSAPMLADPSTQTANSAAPASELREQDCWHLSLRFAPDVLKAGMDPLSFIRYLGTLGRVTQVMMLTDALPDDAAAFDPENLYIGFEVSFVSDADKASIENVFEFVRDDAIIGILPPRSRLTDLIALIETLPETPERLGEILVASGALTPAELQHVLRLQAATPDNPPLMGSLLVKEQLVHEGVVQAALHRQQEQSDKRPAEQRFIKVDVDKLDRLVTLVGELVIASAASTLAVRESSLLLREEAAERVAGLVEGIRDASLNLRMVPIGETFQRYPRVVRDIAKDLGKKIELQMSGTDTELDKAMVEKLADPLTHIIRNSCDHGIETPEKRRAAGKPEAGTLRLNAFHDSGAIVIEVRDDGAGLNRERIRQKAIERGLISADQTLSDGEVYKLIFEAGFSTAEQVTNLSGRGVGMDVVKKNIESLHGEVAIRSVEGQGATVRIQLPLTLAIIDGFQVMVGDGAYVLPLESVIECADLTAEHRQGDLVNLRGQPLPIMRLRNVFELPGEAPARECLVVVQHAGEQVGLVVDRLAGQLQAVVKPLGALFRHMPVLSGSTILGNGDVALMLDLPHLVAQACQQAAREYAGTAPRAGNLKQP